MSNLTVAISSTVFDLQDHREEVRKVCMALDVRLKMMEDLKASSVTPLAASEKLIQDADVYVGIFGRRYGHIPDGDELSITHRELKKAEDNKIECLIFLSSESHLWYEHQIDQGTSAEAISALRDRLKEQYTCVFFDDPSDLRSKLAEALNAVIVRRSNRLTEVEADIRVCEGHLRWLTDLKGMHDSLHRIEIECYRPINRLLGSQSYSENEASSDKSLGEWIEITSSVSALISEVERLVATLSSNEDLATEKSWIDALEQTKADMKLAHDDRCISDIHTANGVIGWIVHRQLDRLNARLITEARSFSNTALIRRVRENGDYSSVEHEGQLFTDTLKKLDELVEKHDAWQNVYGELLLVDPKRNDSFKILDSVWKRVSGHTERIYGTESEEWPLVLSAVDEALNQAGGISGDDSDLSLYQGIEAFCAFAGQEFDRVDQSLKDTCKFAVTSFSQIVNKDIGAKSV